MQSTTCKVKLESVSASISDLKVVVKPESEPNLKSVLLDYDLTTNSTRNSDSIQCPGAGGNSHFSFREGERVLPEATDSVVTLKFLSKVTSVRTTN